MDTLFLIASKTVWFYLRPETLLLLLFAVPLIFLRRDKSRAATASLTLALSTAVVIGMFPVGNLVLNPLERSFPANPDVQNPAGIIVLGGAEDAAPAYAGGFAQVDDAGDRLIATISLARRYPEAVVLYSGGKVALTPVEQGSFELGPDVLRRLGLSEDRLIIEGQSRTTAENATRALALKPETSGGQWILVTSASHMRRALGSFCAAGWDNLVPYPTDYRGGAFWADVGWNFADNLGELNVGVKEWIGLAAYRIAGRVTTLTSTAC